MKLEDRVQVLETAFEAATQEIARVDALLQAALERVTVLENGKARGPKTERPMTEADAYRVRFGDHKDMNHKEAAAALGLSYGQVFSCRGGYTFKQVKDKTRNADGTEAKPAAPEGGAK